MDIWFCFLQVDPDAPNDDVVIDELYDLLYGGQEEDDTEQHVQWRPREPKRGRG